MGGFMLVPSEINKFDNKLISGLGLKTHRNPSHNLSDDDAAIIELVRFLARCAAEEDYQFYMDALAQHQNIKG